MTDPTQITGPKAHAAPRRKLRFDELVRAIREQARTADHPDALDRRRVLARLCAEFAVQEELLLLRGFDRAYRRVIEGV
jgi:hypothetical protein